MKRLFICLATAATVTFLLGSCTATKRDCQGVKHTRLKNGIYL